MESISLDTMPAEVAIVYILFYAVYAAVVVPYCAGRIFAKFGESLRFWYFLFLFLHVFGVAYALFKFRNRMVFQEKAIVGLFYVGYGAINIPLFVPLDTLSTVWHSDLLLYSAVGICGVALIPWYGSKIISKALGKSENFWFLILVFLNWYALTYVLIKYRKRLLEKERMQLSLLLSSYLVGFILVIAIILH